MCTGPAALGQPGRGGGLDTGTVPGGGIIPPYRRYRGGTCGLPGGTEAVQSGHLGGRRPSRWGASWPLEALNPARCGTIVSKTHERMILGGDSVRSGSHRNVRVAHHRVGSGLESTRGGCARETYAIWTRFVYLINYLCHILFFHSATARPARGTLLCCAAPPNPCDDLGQGRPAAGPAAGSCGPVAPPGGRVRPKIRPRAPLSPRPPLHAAPRAWYRRYHVLVGGGPLGATFPEWRGHIPPRSSHHRKICLIASE